MVNTSSDPVVALTPGAAAQVKELIAKEGRPAGTGLRLYVEQGGCSGRQFGLVFDSARPDDIASEHDGVGVWVDPTSAPYLRGAVLDYVDSLMGGGFKLSNPNARHACGCGKSFEA